MSILWCGGEDIDFSGNIYVSPNGSMAYRSGYARTSLYGSYALGKPFTQEVTSCWVSFQLYNANNTTYNYIGLVQSSVANNKGLFLNSDTQKLQLSTYNGTTRVVLASEAGTSMYSNTMKKIDFQVINYGTTGTVNVYMDNVLLITYTGDLTVTGVTAFDAISLCATNGTASISEIIVADEDTRLMSLVTLAPNAAGDTNAWTGAYTDINETSLNDASVVYTNATGSDAQFSLSNLPSGTFTVKAVKLAARASKSAGATAGSVCLGVKSAGTIDAGTAQACDTSWVTKERLMQQNPVTSNIWQSSEINALQLNIRSAA